MADLTDPSGDKKLDNIEERSERTRADFAATVAELQHRFSTAALKDNVRERLHGARQGMLWGNPLRTVALGTALAYPAWRVVRNLPVPFLLLGAGAALAGGQSRYGRSEASRSRADTAGRPVPSHAVAMRSPEGGGQTGPGTGAPAESGDAVNAAPRDWGSGAFKGSIEVSAQAGQRAGEVGRAGRDGLLDAVERHPALLGSIAVIAGAAVAALLPSSRIEGRYLGEASDDVKEQARSLATRGLEVVRASAERIVEGTLEEAEEQGLTSQNAKGAAKDLAKRASAVADRAAEATSSNGASSGDAPNGSQT